MSIDQLRANQFLDRLVKMDPSKVSPKEWRAIAYDRVRGAGTVDIGRLPDPPYKPAVPLDHPEVTRRLKEKKERQHPSYQVHPTVGNSALPPATVRGRSGWNDDMHGGIVHRLEQQRLRQVSQYLQNDTRRAEFNARGGKRSHNAHVVDRAHYVSNRNMAEERRLREKAGWYHYDRDYDHLPLSERPNTHFRSGGRV